MGLLGRTWELRSRRDTHPWLSLPRATVTKYHGLNSFSTTEFYFSQFCSREDQDQGTGRFGDWSSSKSGYRQTSSGWSSHGKKSERTLSWYSHLLEVLLSTITTFRLRISTDKFRGHLQSVATSEPSLYTTEPPHLLVNLSVYSIPVLDALHIYRSGIRGHLCHSYPWELRISLLKRVIRDCSVAQTLTCWATFLPSYPEWRELLLGPNSFVSQQEDDRKARSGWFFYPVS